MADHGASISLSQGRDLSQTSDEDSSDQSSHTVATLSPTNTAATAPLVAFGSACGGSSSVSKHKNSPPSSHFFITDDPNQHHQQISSPTTISQAMVEVSTSKKPRGRPPGSKNKPKPPIVITKDSDSAMKPVILEISAGFDVVECLIYFARKRHVGIIVLSGSGSVSNVTLRHPLSHAPALSLHGPLSIVSLYGSYVTSSPSSSSASLIACPSFGICLAGAQGQVFGGIVGGKVVAASIVVVMVSTFVNPAFHRLPNEVDETEETKPNAGGDNDNIHANVSEGGCTNNNNVMPMSVYTTACPNPLNCQVPPDVMPWTPASRPPY